METKSFVIVLLAITIVVGFYAVSNKEEWATDPWNIPTLVAIIWAIQQSKGK